MSGDRWFFVPHTNGEPPEIITDTDDGPVYVDADGVGPAIDMTPYIESVEAHLQKHLEYDPVPIATPDEFDLDPRWQWIDVRQFGSESPRWIRAACRHLEVVPVESVAGEVVARLCLTCDAQLPAGTVT